MAWLLPVLLQLSVVVALLMRALALRHSGDEAACHACIARARAVLERAARRVAARRAPGGETGLARGRYDAARVSAAAVRHRPGAATASRRAGMRGSCARPVPTARPIVGTSVVGTRHGVGRARGVPIRPPDRRKRGLRPASFAARFVPI
jgi:hypothetical protein